MAAVSLVIYRAMYLCVYEFGSVVPFGISCSKSRLPGSHTGERGLGTPKVRYHAR